MWVCACVLTLRVHVLGCGGARLAVTDALGGAKGGGRWTALEGGIVTVAHFKKQLRIVTVTNCNSCNPENPWAMPNQRLRCVCVNV